VNQTIHAVTLEPFERKSDLLQEKAVVNAPFLLCRSPLRRSTWERRCSDIEPGNVIADPLGRPPQPSPPSPSPKSRPSSISTSPLTSLRKSTTSSNLPPHALVRTSRDTSSTGLPSCLPPQQARTPDNLHPSLAGTNHCNPFPISTSERDWPTAASHRLRRRINFHGRKRCDRKRARTLKPQSQCPPVDLLPCATSLPESTHQKASPSIPSPRRSEFLEPKMETTFRVCLNPYSLRAFVFLVLFQSNSLSMDLNHLTLVWVNGRLA
jgi:hypothetical protein